MNPLYHQARFLLSTPDLRSTPDDQGYEVAFAGRSNAGKSSAINTITKQKNLARTSKTPGRTQQLVYFELDEQRRLVDLPGYGFAKVPIPVQKQWQRDLEDYLEQRQSLNGLVLLVDIRRQLSDYDIQMIKYADYLHLDVFVALTKADKLNRNNANKALFAVQKQTNGMNGHIRVGLFSSLKKEGVDPLHFWLDEHLAV